MKPLIIIDSRALDKIERDIHADCIATKYDRAFISPLFPILDQMWFGDVTLFRRLFEIYD